ncbi:MAG: hypothetical protein QXD19_00185 [Candidatus Bathyarchaeia archaeon]
MQLSTYEVALMSKKLDDALAKIGRVASKLLKAGDRKAFVTLFQAMDDLSYVQSKVSVLASASAAKVSKRTLEKLEEYLAEKSGGRDSSG